MPRCFRSVVACALTGCVSTATLAPRALVQAAAEVAAYPNERAIRVATSAGPHWLLTDTSVHLQVFPPSKKPLSDLLPQDVLVLDLPLRALRADGPEALLLPPYDPAEPVSADRLSPLELHYPNRLQTAGLVCLVVAGTVLLVVVGALVLLNQHPVRNG